MDNGLGNQPNAQPCLRISFSLLLLGVPCRISIESSSDSVDRVPGAFKKIFTKDYKFTIFPRPTDQKGFN